ncbi:molybdenum cofactor guanylyltransferase [Flavobacterium sp. ASW18X]|uniref:molybdenum cofactor guanylyltransferase n=1 Tax=Flavobacterium sp. ASW18X TaxID=2572595 RepID=UPI0010AE7E6F|nr:NTP transferase domain-containing protein [Flavobacterium sp. ASW18X]TKD66065.1 molybdenum cofactor guanylyltransferase [Flavobacterium sp. ASW18X]
MNQATKIYGLVLSGGKSTRMGKDKGLLQYHDVPQREYLYQLLSAYCDAVYYSVRPNQDERIPKERIIIDLNEYKGPLNGILSAHKKHPNVAWLVLACDLPLLNHAVLAQLVQERDRTKTATAMATQESKLPEPLIAIWEPQGLIDAKAYMDKAQSSCPRKFLINADTKLIYPEQDEWLYNANTLEEYQFAKQKLG